MTAPKNPAPALRTVTVMLQLDPVVYRALVRTADLQNTQVHSMIEAQLLKAVTTPGNAKHRPITDKDMERWVALWREGKSDSEIGRLVNRAPHTVSKRLRAAGCPSNGVGGAKPRVAVEEQAA